MTTEPQALPEQVCPVCGGRASACAILGHRPEEDRGYDWQSRSTLTAQPVADGWQIVPKDATLEMLHAMSGNWTTTGKARQRYAEMLAAAPAHPAPDTQAKPLEIGGERTTHWYMCPHCQMPIDPPAPNTQSVEAPAPASEAPVVLPEMSDDLRDALKELRFPDLNAAIVEFATQSVEADRQSRAQPAPSTREAGKAAAVVRRMAHPAVLSDDAVAAILAYFGVDALDGKAGS